MPPNSNDLASTESLMDELNDEELAACVGGCDIELTAGKKTVATVPLVEVPLLGNVSVKINDISVV